MICCDGRFGWSTTTPNNVHDTLHYQFCLHSLHCCFYCHYSRKTTTLSVIYHCCIDHLFNYHHYSACCICDWGGCSCLLMLVRITIAITIWGYDLFWCCFVCFVYCRMCFVYCHSLSPYSLATSITLFSISPTQSPITFASTPIVYLSISTPTSHNSPS